MLMFVTLSAVTAAVHREGVKRVRKLLRLRTGGKKMLERDKFIQIIKRSLSGWLNCHIIRKIAPLIADALIENGAVIK